MTHSSDKIYHITHLDNLAEIIADGFVLSDSKMIALGKHCASVGLSEIKRRRIEELIVSCHPGTNVGEYVPFYFCPRSIMLYIFHMDNHPDLTYHGGQRPILHLQADITNTIHWADKNNVRWAFSPSNAGARYTQFYNKTSSLDKIDWDAVQNRDFRDPLVKEGKQAEFLTYEYFPWELIEKIGVFDEKYKQDVDAILRHADYKPLVEIERDWYY